MKTEIDIVTNNTANYVIALPDEYTDLEQLAADELAYYIKAMTGAVMKTLPESAVDGYAVYIGNTEFAKRNGIWVMTETDEAWVIRGVGGNLVLTGGILKDYLLSVDDGILAVNGALRGVLYSVYHLLEDYFGVRWWTPYEEHVPRANDLILPLNISASGKPAFKNRDMHTDIEKNRMGAGWGKIYDSKYGKGSLFYTRNRMNGTFAPATAKYGGMDAFGAPYITHTTGIYYPPYAFSAHPEYYALIAGERFPYGQLCMTNEDLMRDITEKIKESIQISNEAADTWGQPRPEYYSLSTNDTGYFCECPTCAAMTAQKGTTGYLLNFVNRVAQGIKDDYPEVKIETLAFWQTVDIPKDNTKPDNNVIVRIADNYMDILHNLDHPNNANTLKRLREWSNFVGEGQLFIWDYGINLEINPPMPTMYNYANKLRKYLEYGATGYFIELQNSLTADFWDMKAWMIAKLMENPYLDSESLADTFINGYYGSAAPHIKKYLEMMLETSSKSWVSVQYGTNIFNTNYVTLDNVIKGLGYFKSALESTTDPVIIARINFARVSLDKIIANRHSYFVSTAKSQGLYDDKLKELIDGIAAAERVIACLEQQLELKGSDEFAPGNVRLAEEQIAVFREIINRLEQEN